MQHSDTEDSNLPLSELYDLQEVLTTEHKWHTRASKLPEVSLTLAVLTLAATPAPPTMPSTALAPSTSTPFSRPQFSPSTGAFRPPQFKYQANIEDQDLTDKLTAWLLEGKLTQTTQAHILAASAPVWKTLADRLCPR